jgi:hypothetical protein
MLQVTKFIRSEDSHPATTAWVLLALKRLGRSFVRGKIVKIKRRIVLGLGSRGGLAARSIGWCSVSVLVLSKLTRPMVQGLSGLHCAPASSWALVSEQF